MKTNIWELIAEHMIFTVFGIVVISVGSAANVWGWKVVASIMFILWCIATLSVLIVIGIRTAKFIRKLFSFKRPKDLDVPLDYQGIE